MVCRPGQDTVATIRSTRSTTLESLGARKRVPSAVKYVVPTLALSMLLLCGESVSARAAGETAITGVIRDAHGTPQLGALVELLGPDATIIARAFTDEHGRYLLSSLLPGEYRLRATAAFLLPVTRNNLQIKGGVRLAADLTMTAIFEAGTWLPTERRTSAEPADDWRWTLRSAANRPLLRLANTPSGTTDPDVSTSSDHARSSVSGGQIAFLSGDGNFGQGGNRQVVTLGRANADGEVSLLKADFGNGSSGAAPSVVVGVGLEHERTWGGGTHFFASFASHPELQTGSSLGLQILHTAATEQMSLGDAVLIDAGTLFTAEHLLGTRFSSAPYVRIAFKPTAEISVEYHLATDRSLQRSSDLDQVSVADEALSDAVGKPVLLKGLHQELAVVRSDDKRVVSLAVYRDSDPVERLQGGGELSQQDLAALPVLYDPNTETLRMTSPGTRTAGVRIAWTEAIAPTLSACFDGQVGSALTPDKTVRQLSDVAGGTHAHTAAALSGTLQMKARRTGTSVDVTYRWQPAHTLTQVDAYDTGPDEAYLGFRFRQRVWAGRRLKGLNAVVEATNLLSEGYEPILGPDGQILFLAQMPRALQGGLAFSF